MKKWAIQPATVVIPRNAKVELIVDSTDVDHGIGVPGLGIHAPVEPGNPATVRFLASKPGTYLMRCTVRCGRGHDRMTGKIVIE